MLTDHEDFWRHRKDIKSSQTIVIQHIRSSALLTVRLTGTARWVNLPGEIPVGPLDDFLEHGWEVVG